MVALLEGAKGLLVLLTGFGLLALVHKDIHHGAVELVRHFHLNPGSHYPRIFLDLADRVTDTRLWAMAAAALSYAVIRFIEAGGLWLRRRWAEIFGALTGGMYIPVEIYELLHGVTWPKATVLVVNLWVVVYLVATLLRNGTRGA